MFVWLSRTDGNWTHYLFFWRPRHMHVSEKGVPESCIYMSLPPAVLLFVPLIPLQLNSSVALPEFCLHACRLLFWRLCSWTVTMRWIWAPLAGILDPYLLFPLLHVCSASIELELAPPPLDLNPGCTPVTCCSGVCVDEQTEHEGIWDSNTRK